MARVCVCVCVMLSFFCNYKNGIRFAKNSIEQEKFASIVIAKAKITWSTEARVFLIELASNELGIDQLN